MPVLTKEAHRKLEMQLQSRMNELCELFESRHLNNPTEGVKGRGFWVHPETMCATKATASELRLAVGDFKNILNEINKLK